MVALNKCNAFVADIHNAVHNLASDVLKLSLSNTATVATNSVWANISGNDLGTAGGYTAGGATVGITSSTQTSGTYKLIASGTVVWTATAAGIGPFRYVTLRNSTPGAGPLIGWYDYGSSITLANTETFTVTFDGTNGIINCT
jgi:hypothetical protein